MKYYAVLNKKTPLTSQLNALAHTSLWMAMKYPSSPDTFSTFETPEGTPVSQLTDYPFIILTAKNGTQLKAFHKALIEQERPHNAFFTDMIDGGSVAQQLETVRTTPLEDLEYVGVITMGEGSEMAELTKRFSLYRNPSA